MGEISTSMVLTITTRSLGDGDGTHMAPQNAFRDETMGTDLVSCLAIPQTGRLHARLLFHHSF